MKNLLFSFSIICLVIVQSNCGILDWFRSKKPTWIGRIDKMPLIEALHPRGLRVSIGDVQHLEVFGFHGKLNHCFGRNDNGTFYGYATQPKNGRWYYIDEDIDLHVGDALHYWIYVKLAGEEYSFPKEVQIINNVIPTPKDLHSAFLTPTPHVESPNGRNPESGLCPCDQVNALNNFAATSSMFPASSADTPENLICKSQVDSLTEVLLDMLKDQDLNSNLLLTGKERSDTPAIDEVSKILKGMELYDLVGKIKFAYYTDCGIYFEMSSKIDKKRILVRAAIDLKNSRYQFVEGDKDKCIAVSGSPKPSDVVTNPESYDVRASV